MAERWAQSPQTIEQQLILPSIRDIAEMMISQAHPNTAQYYLGLAAQGALVALHFHNRGVGTAISIHEDGTETIVVASNEVRTKRSHHYHAEETAIDIYESLKRGDDDYRSLLSHKNLLMRRPSDITEKRVAMYTTLEPCMGCLRRIISAEDVTQVVIGAEDPEGGQMLNGRMDNIAPVFQREAKKIDLKILRPNYIDPESDLYVDPIYKPFLEEILGPEGFDFRIPKSAYRRLYHGKKISYEELIRRKNRSGCEC